MNTIQYGDGHKDAVTRKRELEEAILVPQLSIGDCFVHARVYLHIYIYFHPRFYIETEAKRARVEALRRKLSNQPSVVTPTPSPPGDLADSIS